jgi:DNA-directed RNA polymerase subunit N (RpoN/RPB10)
MRHIVPGIATLAQHLKQIKEAPETYRPERCPHCGKAGVWCHGTYTRKSDRESRSDERLDPLPILRFYCRHCRRTCSVLPECIPPRRWYLWSIQQAAMVLWLAGLSIAKTAEQVLPSVDAIWRWRSRLRACFSEHGFHLRRQFAKWGVHQRPKSLWHAILAELSLSQAMYLLHQLGVVVP